MHPLILFLFSLCILPCVLTPNSVVLLNITSGKSSQSTPSASTDASSFTLKSGDTINLSFSRYYKNDSTYSYNYSKYLYGYEYKTKTTVSFVLNFENMHITEGAFKSNLEIPFPDGYVDSTSTYPYFYDRVKLYYSKFKINYAYCVFDRYCDVNDDKTYAGIDAVSILTESPISFTGQTMLNNTYNISNLKLANVLDFIGISFDCQCTNSSPDNSGGYLCICNGYICVTLK